MPEKTKRVSLSFRARLLGLTGVALMGGLLARLYALQVLEAPTFQQAAVQNSTRVVSVPAPRGLILSREQNVLAGNKVVDVLGLSAYEATLHPKVEGRVAHLLGIPTSQVKADLRNSEYSAYVPTPIGSNISQATALYVAEHANEFPGVTTTFETQRTYPYGSTAAHVLGYVGAISPQQLAKLASKGYAPGDQIGLAGVEASYQNYLHGTPGAEKLIVNSFGQEVGVASKTRPKPGGNVQLTISLPLQRYVDTLLAQRVNQLQGTYNSYFGRYSNDVTGAAVVENVQNGSVLAMASYPTYQPSQWVGGISYANYAKLTNPSSHNPLLNRAISGVYTPGSTFKLATASAALQDGLLTPTTIINDTGHFVIPNCYGSFCSLHNSGGETLGPIDISTAISASDDVFFYTLGYRFYTQQSKFGSTPIQNMAAKYGWGSPTGIALPGEAAGMVDSPALRRKLHALYPKAYPYSTWYVADQLEMSFGQGLTEISPLQMANAYATFANGGTRYVPRIAEGIVNDNGNLVKRFAPKVAGHVPLSPAVRAAILAGFEGVISNPLGTAHGIFLGWPESTYTLAGKTGTASVQGQVPNAWFVAFGPEPNPKYVVVVVIKEGGFGDTGAAPVVRKIFQYLKDHPVGPPTYGLKHLAAGSTAALNAPHHRSVPAKSTGSAKGGSNATAAKSGASSGG
ncbi:MULTISPECIES: penicillin-binding protein 2 [Ferrimicrobium]|uniref:Penicillin-binding protein 2 n=1 Tax=Ferrimicrobium acidiphilum TaxID=121039 RepID=A0ABV3XZ52_9ACTN|nr:penicillin-binding protein 2 [Ferrimicrobium sp.]